MVLARLGMPVELHEPNNQMIGGTIMKKMIFTLSISLMAMLAIAGHNNSELTLKLWNNSSFTVIINGEEHFVRSANEFTVSDLAPGKHRLKVLRKRENIGGCAPHYIHSLFNGYIIMPESAVVKGMVTRGRNLRILEVEPLPVVDVCAHGVGMDVCGMGCGEIDDHCDGFDGVVDATGDFSYGPGGYDGYEEPAHMTSTNFEQLKRVIENKSFDSGKMQIAMQAIPQHSVSAQQVRELMELFGFESYKLKLAKFAYDYTVDKENFYLVNDGFYFSSSIRSLNKHISNS